MSGLQTSATHELPLLVDHRERPGFEAVTLEPGVGVRLRGGDVVGVEFGAAPVAGDLALVVIGEHRWLLRWPVPAPLAEQISEVLGIAVWAER